MTATDFSGDALDFDKPKWIKQNRKYPADPPSELRAYRDFLSYEIPQKITLTYTRAGNQRFISLNSPSSSYLELHLLYTPPRIAFWSTNQTRTTLPDGIFDVKSALVRHF